MVEWLGWCQGTPKVAKLSPKSTDSNKATAASGLRSNPPETSMVCGVKLTNSMGKFEWTIMFLHVSYPDYIWLVEPFDFGVNPPMTVGEMLVLVGSILSTWHCQCDCHLQKRLPVTRYQLMMHNHSNDSFLGLAAAQWLSWSKFKDRRNVARWNEQKKRIGRPTRHLLGLNHSIPRWNTPAIMNPKFPNPDMAKVRLLDHRGDIYIISGGRDCHTKMSIKQKDTVI